MIPKFEKISSSLKKLVKSHCTLINIHASLFFIIIFFRPLANSKTNLKLEKSSPLVCRDH